MKTKTKTKIKKFMGITMSDDLNAFIVSLKDDELEMQNEKLRMRLYELVEWTRSYVRENTIKDETIKFIAEQNRIISENVQLYKEKADQYHEMFLSLETKHSQEIM